MVADVTARLDYMQRFGTDATDPRALLDAAAPLARCVLRVRAIGTDRQPEQPRITNRERPTTESERLISALFAQRVPIAFQLGCSHAMIRAEFGSWSNTSAEIAASRQGLIEAGLRLTYPAIRLEPGLLESEETLDHAGYVLGLPDAMVSDDGPVPADDLIRGMGLSEPWQVTILAEPLALNLLQTLRSDLLADLGDVKASQHFDGAPSFLVDHYLELGKQLLEMYTLAAAQGAWRAAVYLRGTAASYPVLAGLWSGLHSGDRSTSQPLRIHAATEAAAAAVRWGMPDTRYPRRDGGPGFRHLLSFQSILSSAALAQYCLLPRREAPGLRQFFLPRLDAEPRAVGGDAPEFGRVVRHPEEVIKASEGAATKDHGLGALVKLDVDGLSTHALVVGTTGSGKTTTLYAVLQATVDRGVPFLIIEPAKREYRGLMKLDWATKMGLRIFTLGDERVTPLRVNPFEPAHPGASVAAHLDLLKSVFTASFGMWSPLPQILERSLIEIYEDAGWDLATNSNRRVPPGAPIPDQAWPTLMELRDKVDTVVGALGYEQKIADDMRASLVTRLDGLCLGAKGRMLNTRRSVAMADLLGTPTILELEAIGDDDDKAFVMGLMVVRLYEYLRAEGRRDGLHTLLVVEEAHRLLKQAEATGRAEDASPRAKAVEMFTDLLAEVRAYGQGVIIVDQSPSILAPAALKNTNLKIVHRIVALEDRLAMAGSMALSEEDSAVMAALPTGFAAMFGGGDDRPLLVRVTNLKSTGAAQWPEDKEVIERNARLPLLVDPSDPYANSVRRIASDRAFQLDMRALVLALIDPTTASEPALENLEQRIRSLVRAGESPELLKPQILAAGAANFAARRGRERGLKFADAEAMGDALLAALLPLSRRDMPRYFDALDRFRETYRALHVRSFDPYPGCRRICPEEGSTALCALRDFVRPIVRPSARPPADEELGDYWASALDDALAILPDQIAENGATHRRVALCLIQQTMAAAPRAVSLRTIDRVLAEGGVHGV